MTPEAVPIPPVNAVSDAAARREERKFLWIAIAYELLILIAVAAVSILIWNRGPYKIMFVPVDILEWGFVGGATGVLFRVAYLHDAQTVPVRFATWVIAKPVIGMVMGGLVYLVAISGELALNGKDVIQNIQFLNVLAFLGGFSDRFSIELIDRIVDRRGREYRESSPRT